jgi:HKD family nuclease
MKLEHLTNRSTIALQSDLEASFKKYIEFSIGTAFINGMAIDIMETALRKKKSTISGRLLIGLYGHFNKKRDLERLLGLVNKYPDRLQVHISLDTSFHWKYYQLGAGKQRVFYVGSANFTTGGMTDNRELVIKISDTVKSSDRALSNLAKSFDREWLHSRRLEEFPLKHYREAEQPEFVNGDNNKEVNNFFNRKVTSKDIRVRNGKTYAVGLYNDASPATCKAIENKKSDWLKSGFDWFVLPTRRIFDTCASCSTLFVFSKEGKDKVYCWYSDMVDDDPNIETPDGKYFIAYKPIKRIELTRLQKEKLREAPVGIDLIGWKNPFYCKVLGKKQLASINKIIGF